MRHILLTVAALAVFGLGIYLFLEVRAAPATADVPRRGEAMVRDDAPALEAVKESAPSEVKIPRRGSEPRNPRSTNLTPTPTPATPEDDQKIDALMSEASKAYDHGEFEEAQNFARRVLAKEATNVRMLRIMVSASCIDGASVEAQKYYLLLAASDREQMKTRCDRYGITFNEK